MQKEQIQFYVKDTSNCEGLSLTTLYKIGPEWTGDSIELPFGPQSEIHPVVGWTDLFGGRPCKVKVFKAVVPNGEVGYVVLGGNSGVRILDEKVEPILGIDDHLPRGWGMPIIFVESPEDLPAEIRAIVEVQHSGDIIEDIFGDDGDTE